MGKINHKNIEILNRIDMGSDGKFDANSGMEAQLAAKLNEMENGEKELNRLARRGAVRLNAPTEEAEPQTADEEDDESDDTKKVEEESTDESADDTDTDTETEEEAQEDESDSSDEEDDEELRLEATGEYYKKHYGGGNYYIVDPQGVVVDTVTRSQGGDEAAEERVAELNANIEE